MVKESVLVQGPFTTDAAVGSGWVSDVSFTFTPLKPQKKDKLLCLFPSETTEEEKWTVLFRQGSRRRKDHYIQFHWKPQPSEKCSQSCLLPTLLSTHTHTHIGFEVLNSCHGDGFGCISYAGNILINLDDDSVTVLPEKSTSIHKQTIEIHNE